MNGVELRTVEAVPAEAPRPAAGRLLASLEDVGVRRDGRWLVRHVGLSIREGEIVTVIGPNGSGKTTSVKALLGLVRPDEGRVLRADSLRVGYVPQKLAIDWTLPLSVERLMTLTAPHPRSAIREALAETGVADLAGARVQTLSGGEFQRVLLARALVGKPDLLVLDEPVQGVDFTGEIAMYELIRKLRDRLGCGVLMISHDLHIVMAQTDTVICLNGHVCCHGTPEAVAESPEYRKIFGPRAARTLAVYRHDHDHVHGAGGEVIADGHGHHHHHGHGAGDA
ncbi:MAG: ATP-binding cassette domain-containing protein [Flavobacteriaceae bacterium]